MLGKTWYVYVGSSWVGTVDPVGNSGDWIEANFHEGDHWGNFAPWFTRAFDAYHAGDDGTWDDVYGQLATMGIVLEAEDGERYENPTLLINGGSAWIAT